MVYEKNILSHNFFHRNFEISRLAQSKKLSLKNLEHHRHNKI